MQSDMIEAVVRLTEATLDELDLDAEIPTGSGDEEQLNRRMALIGSAVGKLYGAIWDEVVKK